MGAVTMITRNENILLFLGMGLLYMFVQAPPKFSKAQAAKSVFLIVSSSGIVWSAGDNDTLWNIALFFAKAGSFVFGSGLAIVPFLHSGVVTQFHWLNEKQFLDAVAVAMITPGPVVITVGFIGYLQAGVLGAAVAALATFLPCYLLTIFPAPYMKKYGKNKSVKAFVDGITAAVVGALSGAVIIIALNTFTQNHSVTIDIPSVIIALTTAIILLRTKKIHEPQLILAAAVLGLLIKHF
jgi:chromate transporter